MAAHMSLQVAYKNLSDPGVAVTRSFASPIGAEILTRLSFRRSRRR